MKHIGLALAALTCIALAVAQGNSAMEDPAQDAPVIAPETVQIPTGTDVALEGFLHRPQQANGVAVVLAPGQGYHMDLPLVKRSCEGLAEAGFTALRFDWAYHTSGGRPSPELATERDNLEAALDYAKQLPGIERVILGGKSMGSGVALSVAQKRCDELSGLALLTYPIHRPGSPDEPFSSASGFDAITVPVLFVCGDNDPLSELRPLYSLAAAMKVSPCVSIVPGDHSMREAGTGEQNTEENIGLAVESLVLWCRRWIAE